jgi:UrcA family protein
MTMNTTNITARTNFNARRLVLATLAASCLAAASTVAHAAEQSRGSEAAMKTVQYGDLNLAKPEGVARLYRRIVAAAQQVCDSRQGRSLQAQAQDSICTKESIARAVAAVDQPTLTALHAVKTGQPGGFPKLAKQ